jgi:hypothetical protein
LAVLGITFLIWNWTFDKLKYKLPADWYSLLPNECLHVVSAALTMRSCWTTAELVLAVLLVFSALLAMFDLFSELSWKSSDSSGTKVAWTFVLLLMLGSSVVLTTRLWVNWRSQSANGIATPYLENVLNRLEAAERTGLCDHPDLSRISPTVNEWTSLNGYTDAIAGGTILLVAFAFGSLLRDLPLEGQNVLRELARRRRKATHLLYASAALLVASVVQLLILLSWPAAYLTKAQEPIAADLRAMAGGKTLMVGVFFSLLLFALSGPVFARLDHEARTSLMTGTGKTEAKVNGELAKSGFGLAVWGNAARLIAALSPAIAAIAGSSVADVFTKLVSK